jgi:Phage Tail Collar Domain
MNNIVTVKNTPVAGRRPTGFMHGELYFNFGDRTLGCVDANGVPVDIATAIPVSATAPENPVPGMLWFNNSEDPAVLLVFTGDDQPDPWITVSTSVPIASLEQALAGEDNETVMTPFLVRQVLDVGGAGSSVSVGDDPPVSPDAGQLWFKTSAPVGLFLWFQDVDSAQWVQVGGGGMEPIDIVQGAAGWQVVGDQLICWGSATTLSTGPATVVFARAFQTTPAVSVTPNHNAANFRTASFGNRTSVQMEVSAWDHLGARVGMNVNWIAVGEAANADKMPKSVGGVIGLDTGSGGSGGGGGGAVGALIWHTGTAPPEGYLVADGSPVTATHPELRALYLAAGSPFGVSGADPRLPNLTAAGGRFIRAALSGAGVGVTQADAFQTHGHRNTSSRIGGSGGSGELLGTNDTPATGTRTGRVTAPVLEGTGGTPRVDTETRPVNIALLPCIQAVPPISGAAIEAMRDELAALKAADEEKDALLRSLDLKLQALEAKVA